jgi:hypothetical protein
MTTALIVLGALAIGSIVYVWISTNSVAKDIEAIEDHAPETRVFHQDNK